LFAKINNKFAVKCHTKVAPDCLLKGEYCDSEEDAQAWVEEDCWIFSGEGWFCPKCNSHFMQNLSKVRRVKGQKPPPDDDLDLYKGIETIL